VVVAVGQEAVRVHLGKQGAREPEHLGEDEEEEYLTVAAADNSESRHPA